MRIFILIFSIVGSAPASWAASGASADTVELAADEVRRKLWRKAPWVREHVTIAADRSAFSAIIYDMLQTARRGEEPSPFAVDQAIALDLAVELWRVGDQSYAALVDQAPEDRGWGTYVVRIEESDGGRETLLQAPHAFHDRHTGDIAQALFFDPGIGPRARALFVNTRQRFRGPGGRDKRRHKTSFDVCHNHHHPYSSATIAALSVDPTLRVVQLHGFARRKGQRVIISAGLPMLAPDYVVGVRDALREFGWKAKAYPIDVSYLGATRNVQGRLSRGVAGSEFLHVEMAPGVRERLKRDPKRRLRFAHAVLLGPHDPVAAVPQTTIDSGLPTATPDRSPSRGAARTMVP